MSTANKDPWASYRAYRRRGLIAVLSIFGVPVLFFSACSILGISENYGLVLSVVWVLLVKLDLAIHPYRCPRCGRNFHQGYIGVLPYHNDFTRKCVHCGLRKWTTVEDWEPASDAAE